MRCNAVSYDPPLRGAHGGSSSASRNGAKRTYAVRRETALFIVHGAYPFLTCQVDWYGYNPMHLGYPVTPVYVSTGHVLVWCTALQCDNSVRSKCRAARVGRAQPPDARCCSGAVRCGTVRAGPTQASRSGSPTHPSQPFPVAAPDRGVSQAWRQLCMMQQGRADNNIDHHLMVRKSASANASLGT